MTRRLPVVAAVTLLLAFSLAGCGVSSKTGEASNTGILTGYEIGNQQDIADTRKERPDYRPFE